MWAKYNKDTIPQISFHIPVQVYLFIYDPPSPTNWFYYQIHQNDTQVMINSCAFLVNHHVGWNDMKNTHGTWDSTYIKTASVQNCIFFIFSFATVSQTQQITFELDFCFSIVSSEAVEKVKN